MTHATHTIEGAACSLEGHHFGGLAFRFQLALAIGVGVLVCLVGPAAACLAAAALVFSAFFVFGPSRFSLCFFLVYMVASHQYISPFTFVVVDVEWHPREILLGLLLAHGTVKALQGRARFTPEPIHAAMLLLALSFVFMATVGIARQQETHGFLQECRYPIFLLCYPVVVMLAANPSDVRFYGGTLASLTAAIALAALGFSAYATLTGHGLQLNQTVLGEFMTLRVGATTLQTVRPNGHLFFEVFLVLCVSVVLAKGVGRRHRVLALGGAALFAGAILITAMRTAYVAVLIALAILFFLMLPSRRVQFAGVVFAAVSLMFALAWVGPTLRDAVADAIARDVSLQGRVVEIRGASCAFLDHPIAGNGMGSSFEGLGLAQSGQQLAAGPAAYQTVHNVWMYYLLKGGLAGFLLALAGFGAILARGYLLIPALHEPVARALMRGLVASYAGQLVASLAMPRLIYPSGYCFVAVVACVFAQYGMNSRQSTSASSEHIFPLW